MAASEGEAALPSRTPSQLDAAAQSNAGAREAARTAAADAQREVALTYVPLASASLAPEELADQTLLSLVPPELAARAERYQAAASAAYTALQRQADTVRRLQFAAARMRAEIYGREVPADGWDRASAGEGAAEAEGRPISSADRAHKVGADLDPVGFSVRRLVHMHAVPPINVQPTL